MTSAILIEEVSRLVTEITGVQLGKKQSAMVESRLTRRMLQLGLRSPEDYLQYISRNRDAEVSALVSLLTTHHTTFFREFSHFEYLESHALPALVQDLRKRGEKVVRVWSAACSRGHEVYSLSMFLDFHLKRLAPEMSYEILGSDVDPQSVEIARNGVYRWDDIKSAPSMYLGNHWVRGTGEISEFVKAKASIKNSCSFQVANLLDFAAALGGRKFDIIFCRNVFIYFTIEQVKSITTRLLDHLTPSGYLFIGISESLNGTSLPVTYLAPSVYSHRKGEAAKPAKVQPPVAAPVLPLKKAPEAPVPALAAATVAPAAPVAVVPAAKPAAKVKVFCIDDSATILSLLKKILTPDLGFEVIGTAENGLDAAEKLKTLRPDVVTLDIHMPKQTGVEYLQANMRPAHPPVVMVTSVSREDAGLGLRSLELGATDYVEKPSLADLAKRADEIRTKLRCAAMSRQQGLARGVLEVERQFQKSYVIASPETKLRVILAGIGDREKLAKVIEQLRGQQPPTVILLQGSEVLLEGLAGALKGGPGGAPTVIKDLPPTLQPGKVYLAHASRLETIRAAAGQRRTSILAFGDVTGDAVPPLLKWTWPAGTAHLCLEDMGDMILSDPQRELVGVAQKVVPYSSFAYHSDEYLSEGKHRE